MNAKKLWPLVFGLALYTGANAQNCYWQQHVKYVMDVELNASTNLLSGKQRLEYTNHSPDTLRRAFYHLYWNAFQPGSMMDERSRRQGTITIGNQRDWDDRVADRIQHLKTDQIGYQKIRSLKMNGIPQKFEVLETILEVTLSRPILPKQKVVFELEFEAQPPLQIRRSGRDNPKTQVRYSMSQWYPKICAYDKNGWQPTPYVGREFYGEYGDFEVNITLDKNYCIGATGYLTNAQQIGYGYELPGTKITRPTGSKLTWKFFAPNVHDFMWAADTAFIHKTRQLRKDLTLHLLYKPVEKPAEEWEDILVKAEKAFPFIEKKFGAYPYKQFSFITGGDGGMEYPMATLLAGPGAWLHELMHNWYYGVLGTDEGKNHWMDEGFTSFAENEVKAWLNNIKDTAQIAEYRNYFAIAKSNLEEPMITHADHFNTNMAYGVATYSKGAIFLAQLGYIVSDSLRDKLLLDYFNTWKFKHPDAADFVRVAEKTTGMKLDWYQQYWINSTRKIDYAIDSLWEEEGKTKIRLRRDGLMPMPIDFLITFRDGTKEMHYVPLDLMYGNKPQEDKNVPRKVYAPWYWTKPTYIIESSRKILDIRLAEIDPSQRMADVQRANNRLELRY